MPSHCLAVIDLPVQLPEELRALAECPFPLDWKPVVTILAHQGEVHGEGLRETLRRKGLARMVVVMDL